MGGGEALVQGATRISQNLSVSPLVVGFTVVAVGTSLPELAVAIEAVRTDSPDIAIGGVLGSNVANVMLVLGAAALFGAKSQTGDAVKRFSGCCGCHCFHGLLCHHGRDSDDRWYRDVSISFRLLLLHIFEGNIW